MPDKSLSTRATGRSESCTSGRYEARMAAWPATGDALPFISDEVRAAWRQRVQILRDAIELM